MIKSGRGSSSSPHPEVLGAARRALKDAQTDPSSRPSRPASRAPRDEEQGWRGNFGAHALAFAFALIIAIGGAGLVHGVARADPTFPPLTGRVVDDAHVLSPEIQADLTAKLAALEAKSGDQLVVVTLPSLQGYPIEDFGYQLGRKWGIGQKGKDTGALFIVVPSEHKVRIEVGYGLEPVLTDALTSVILQERVLPRFKAGDIAGGVVAGTDAIAQQLGLDPAQARSADQAAQSEMVHERPLRHRGGGFPAILIILFVVFVVGGLLRRGGGGGMLWALPFLFMGGGGGGGGGFRDDDDEGGGFSGGGGSFGGGGSSGGW
jgi:uncharacterized protein